MILGDETSDVLFRLGAARDTGEKVMIVSQPG